MPWSVGTVEGMRIKQEIKQVEPPSSLILSNSSTREIGGIVEKRTNNTISPETLSHRLEKGWQHLQECPDPFNNNNNLPLDLNDNNNVDDDSVTTSAEITPSFLDGEYKAMSSDDSGSSSEDESSASFSDTSPLLDVSSLGNSSDVSLDSDMSEDSSSSSSSSSDGCMLDGCNNNNNNEEEEDMSVMDAPSMQSSWMSFSSAASSSSVAGPSRNQVILPDVLPVGKIPKHEDEDPVLCDNSPSASYNAVATRNLEITFEKRRSSQDLSAPRMSGDCCLVEITAQPNVQVDIRVNPVSSRAHRETRSVPIKHGNTYPREARNTKRYLKNRDINAWIVNDSFDEHYDDKSDKYCTLAEGIRLNNFTIVNGYKTLSLTELVNPNTYEESETIQKLDSENRWVKAYSNNKKTTCNTSFKNSYQNFERNYSKLPTNARLCCKDNWRHQKHFNNAVLKKKPANVETAAISKFTPTSKTTEIESYRQKSRAVSDDVLMEKQQKNISPRISGADTNSNKLTQTDKMPQKPREIGRKGTAYYSSKKKTIDSKTSSPELFEVYTMETALPQINWAAISKGSRENDWIQKRRNDREEIRRKLAMDSDTEDYISEKLSQHRDSGGFDRLKSTGNLQICFMNEAAKDQDFSNPDEEVAIDKNKIQVPRKPPIHLPSTTFQKCDKQTIPKTQHSTNSPLSVTKRQRPKFFFNRPRSWHASKQDENPFSEEDLLTRHIRLQTEAREALAQAKDMARMQMEIERQKKKKSPIADIVGLPFPDGKNLLSHHALIAMNVAQLQVIVNDLHSQIETLNEDLVKFLLERDDLHMEQDSMLVDIEDLTRYFGLKGTNSASSGSQVSVNSTTDTKKTSQPEPVRRSQSVHLKSKNLMWPLHQLPFFKESSNRS